VRMGPAHGFAPMSISSKGGIAIAAYAFFATASVRIGSLQFGRTKWQV